ncbi:MAG: ribonuclease III [Candidatus Kapabacteria bacterium]|nr:ribonuclease III [Candidatus Kapabacteria bacterium]
MLRYVLKHTNNKVNDMNSDFPKINSSQIFNTGSSIVIKSELKDKFPELGFLIGDVRESFTEILGVEIGSIGIYEEALTHRSYPVQAESKSPSSNERLEFLGDAILDMIVAEYLFVYYNIDSEGTLTKLRSRLVNKHSLAVCGKKMNIERFLRISHSAAKTVQAGNETILADAMEAIIAAIYLDLGLDEARKFVINKMFPLIIQESLLDDTNYKSRLLELVQAEGKKSPEYIVIEEDGPPHNKNYTVAVVIEGIQSGIGNGKSKKDAEQIAAKRALISHYL